MKKYFVFLGIAALTLAACTKTEIDETAVPDQKIEFNIANYSTQTRAGETALQSEPGLYGKGVTPYFKTIAKFFPAIGDPQTYMNNVEVQYKSTEWSPARDYFWPKTGYINFYSYVSSSTALEPSFDFATTDGKENGNVTVSYTDKTIGAEDNILLAEAALNQTSNTNPATYNTISGVTEGVPTLFHHLLAKVRFTVQLVTTEAKQTTTKFVVTILNDNTIPDGKGLTNLKAPQIGSYEVTNAYDASSSTKAWSELKVWSTKSGVDPETITPSTAPLSLTLENATTSGDPVNLIAERTVLPQTLTDDVTFTISYKIQVYQPGETDPYMTEVFSVPAKALTAFTDKVSAWEINTKYTYAITIDPVGNKIKFDPAVEKWDERAGGSYAISE